MTSHHVVKMGHRAQLLGSASAVEGCPLAPRFDHEELFRRDGVGPRGEEPVMSEVRRFADLSAVADAAAAEFVELAGAACAGVAASASPCPEARRCAPFTGPWPRDHCAKRLTGRAWRCSGRTSAACRPPILSPTMGSRATRSWPRWASPTSGFTGSTASCPTSRRPPGNTSRRSRASSARRRRVPLRSSTSSCSAWALTGTRPRSSRTAGRCRCEAAGWSPTTDQVSVLTESP
jgi:hypothetical protein